MSQPELLRRVVAVLESTGAAYMLVGSWASGLQGEPRSTHDIDLVVTLTPEAARGLLSEFGPPDFYLDEVSIADAIGRPSGQFNLVDVTSGHKVDFWVLADDPFNQNEFARRYVETLDGRPVYVSRPEDTILAKLRWAEMSGGSEKQFGDAKSVYEVQRGTLDLDYIERWAKTLGVESEWERLRREADATA